MMNIDIIRNIYSDKAFEYIDVINLFSESKINFKIFNLYKYSDDDCYIPGDMDILLERKHKDAVDLILSSLGFKLYINSDTNQFQWVKINNFGDVVQIHLHFGLYFSGCKILSLSELSNGLYATSEENLFILVISAHFKKIGHDKLNTKYEFLNSNISSSNFNELLTRMSGYSKYIYFRSLENYYGNFECERKIWCEVRTSVAKIYGFSKKIAQKMISRKSKIKVLFLGVDGAGKSTTIKNVQGVLSNVINNQEIYMGLKESSIYRAKNLLAGNENTPQLKQKNESKINKHSTTKSRLKVFYNFLIGFLYLIEERWVVFTLIDVHRYRARKVFLLDRSYLDCLIYYRNPILQKLFVNFGMRPSIVVFLKGESLTLWLRKKEVSIDNIEASIESYTKIVSDFEKENIRCLSIDTTRTDEKEVRDLITKEIFQKL